MMQYKCSCGAVLKETEIEVESYQENMGEFWGAPAYETFYIYRCPRCGSEELEEFMEADNEE